MRPELRATAQCLWSARNGVDEKTVRLEIITQHGGESRLVFDQQDPRPVEVRYADIPHAEEPITRIREIVKPVSLSLRLFGNVFSGALIFALVSGLFASVYVPIAIIDVVWLPFDLAVFFLQAFIFALLTVIYYQQALDVAHGGH